MTASLCWYIGKIGKMESLLGYTNKLDSSTNKQKKNIILRSFLLFRVWTDDRWLGWFKVRCPSITEYNSAMKLLTVLQSWGVWHNTLQNHNCWNTLFKCPFPFLSSFYCESDIRAREDVPLTSQWRWTGLLT